MPKSTKKKAAAKKLTSRKRETPSTDCTLRCAIDTCARTKAVGMKCVRYRRWCLKKK